MAPTNFQNSFYVVKRVSSEVSSHRSPSYQSTWVELREMSLYVFGTSCHLEMWDVMDVGLAHNVVWYHTICYDTSLERNNLYSTIDYTIPQVCVVFDMQIDATCLWKYHMVYGTILYHTIPTGMLFFCPLLVLCESCLHWNL
jgi:hypothetical protein